MKHESSQTNRPPPTLTRRELDVLRLLARGLSNRQIAAELVFTLGTVKWYLHQIYAKLGVANRGEAKIVAHLQGLVASPPVNVATTRHLPSPATQLLGREEELVRLEALLATDKARLVTILGPGGVGKTHLALTLAQRLASQSSWPDGIHFIDLSDLQHVAQILPQLAERLSLPGGEQPPEGLLATICRSLRDQKVLLIFDNFEHLLGGTAILADIMIAAPQVKILTTSRERLALQAENVVYLEGLAYPNGGQFEDDFVVLGLEGFAAVQLFLEAARRLRPDLTLNEPNDSRQLATICALTAGLPLALIMAAGWIDTLTLAEIADELRQGLDILAAEWHDMPARHRSMRAALDHTWRLLSPRERRRFTRMSVFIGGFSKAAAMAVCGVNTAYLSRLIGKSLLRFEPTERRYRLHPLLRQYAAEKAAELGEIDGAKAAHIEFFLTRVKEVESDIIGPRQGTVLRELQLDYDNIIVAAERAALMGQEALLNGAVHGLWLYFNALILWGPALELRRRLLAAWGEGTVTERPVVWQRIAARHVRPREAEKGLLTELLAQARGRGDQHEEALCLLNLGEAHIRILSVAKGVEYLTQGLALYEQLGARDQALALRYLLANAWANAGEPERALALVEQSAVELRALGDAAFASQAEHFAQNLCWQLGDYDRYIRYATKLIPLNQAVGRPIFAALVEMRLMTIAFLRGDFAAAAAMVARTAPSLDRIDDVVFNYADKRGLLLAARGEYEAALTVLTTGITEVERVIKRMDPNRELCYRLGLTAACCGLTDYAGARQTLRQALARAVPQREVGNIRLYLPVAALLWARTGQPRRAAELLSLAWSQLAGWTGWLEKWPLFSGLAAELELSLGAHAFAAAWARGRERELLATAEELLAEL